MTYKTYSFLPLSWVNGRSQARSVAAKNQQKLQDLAQVFTLCRLPNWRPYPQRWQLTWHLPEKVVGDVKEDLKICKHFVLVFPRFPLYMFVHYCSASVVVLPRQDST